MIGILRSRFVICLCGFVVISGLSCSSDRVKMKSLAPAASSKKAMTRYDADQDGVISVSECSPGLLALMDTADSNNDKQLDETEISNRLAFHQSRKIGLVTTGLTLRVNEKPIQGVKVTLIPDPIFENLASCSGTTDRYGYVNFKIADESLPGAYPGIYSIEVAVNGQSVTLPVGIEVGQDTGQGDKVVDVEVGD